jgi:hypothetical protein
MEEDKTYAYFMQDGATAHTANYFINVLNKVSEDRPWPARCSCDFYLGGPKK